MKPVKAWAVISDGGIINVNSNTGSTEVFLNRNHANHRRFGVDRVVRVEIRELKPKRIRQRGRLSAE